MRRRLAKSRTFEAKVDGWLRRDGSLWMPNLLVDIDASRFSITTDRFWSAKSYWRWMIAPAS
jgi:prophage tail gpP-like protein